MSPTTTPEIPRSSSKREQQTCALIEEAIGAWSELDEGRTCCGPGSATVLSNIFPPGAAHGGAPGAGAPAKCDSSFLQRFQAVSAGSGAPPSTVLGSGATHQHALHVLGSQAKQMGLELISKMFSLVRPRAHQSLEQARGINRLYGHHQSRHKERLEMYEPLQCVGACGAVVVHHGSALSDGFGRRRSAKGNGANEGDRINRLVCRQRDQGDPLRATGTAFSDGPAFGSRISK